MATDPAELRRGEQQEGMTMEFTSKKQSFVGKFVRFGAVGIAVAAVVLTGLIGSNASIADAAGSTTSPDIYGCFTYSAMPVYLMHDTSNVSNRAAVKTNSAGCVRFNDITPGHDYYLYAVQSVFEYVVYDSYTGLPISNCYHVYTGKSPVVHAQKGDTLYRVGTTKVTMTPVGC
jgi:hypothetical protein